MTTLRNALLFLINGPRYDLPVFLSYWLSFIFGTNSQKLTVYTPEELTSILSEGHSIIRLGDGEAMLMTGRSIHYQKTSPALKADLRLVIKNVMPPYILAVPIEALTSTDSTLREKGRLRIWRLFRCFAEKRLALTDSYADAHSFYRQEYLQTLLPKVLTNKHIICISKKSTLDNTLRTYLEQFSLSVTFIESPTQNSYENISTLTEKIASEIRLAKTTPVLLLSAGPASKILAYQFAQKNIQCLDIGHGLEIVGRDMDYSDKI
jgi:Glycosyltransferase GT-D fold